MLVLLFFFFFKYSIRVAICFPFAHLTPKFRDFIFAICLELHTRFLCSATAATCNDSNHLGCGRRRSCW
jgi:hypothetical protein